MEGWREKVEQIRADNVSGATELCLAASEAIKAWASENRFRRALSTLDQLAYVCVTLIEAKPEIAPLINLANFILLRAERCRLPEEVLDEADKGAEEFSHRLRGNLCKVALEAFLFLPQGAKVLTHSSSAAVLEALKEAKGKVSKVICTESRPMLEGVSLARKLSLQGLEVKLITDGLAPFWVRQVDIILVGADSVRMEGVVNKAGTLGIALAAREFGRPLYALAGKEKFVPSGLPLTLLRAAQAYGGVAP